MTLYLTLWALFLMLAAVVYMVWRMDRPAAAIIAVLFAPALIYRILEASQAP
jgi:hypothetical protein